MQESSLAFLFVVFVYALYGLVDDLVDIGRKLKFLIPIIFSFPLISVVSVTDVWLPIYGSFNLETSFYGDILLSDIFRITVIPIYVMVVSNLVNMHSGYNGLQSGLSIIIILSICVKSIEDGTSHQVFPIFAILGSMCAFYTYNKFPSRVFEGNIGSLFFGSAMGASIVTLKLWWFGFFILIPHTLNFLLWIIWLYLMKKNPSMHLDKKGKHTKFGKVRSDGTLKVPQVDFEMDSKLLSKDKRETVYFNHVFLNYSLCYWTDYILIWTLQLKNIRSCAGIFLRTILKLKQY